MIPQKQDKWMNQKLSIAIGTRLTYRDKKTKRTQPNCVRLRFVNTTTAGSCRCRLHVAQYNVGSSKVSLHQSVWTAHFPTEPMEFKTSVSPALGPHQFRMSLIRVLHWRVAAPNGSWAMHRRSEPHQPVDLTGVKVCSHYIYTIRLRIVIV